MKKNYREQINEMRPGTHMFYYSSISLCSSRVRFPTEYLIDDLPIEIGNRKTEVKLIEWNDKDEIAKVETLVGKIFELKHHPLFHLIW